METLNDFDKKNNEQSNVANRLLIDMVNNQKENNKSMGCCATFQYIQQLLFD